jgi:hypothetical protein
MDYVIACQSLQKELASSFDTLNLTRMPEA